MKIQTIIQISALLIFSSTQCMEPEKSKINTNISQTTLIVDNSLINKLIETSKKNKSNPLLLLQRTKRLNLLQQLLNKNASIIFSNNNEAIQFWLNKDETIVSNILYEKLFSFLSYRVNENKIEINHTPFHQQKPFNLTLQYSRSVLYITNQQPLPYNTQKIIERFLRDYKPNTITKTIIKNLPKNAPQPQQQTDECVIHNQETTNIKDLPTQLTDEEHDLFVALPYNTQQILMDILIDQSDVIKL